jgi:hypothetical protein
LMLGARHHDVKEMPPCHLWQRPARLSTVMRVPRLDPGIDPYVR